MSRVLLVGLSALLLWSCGDRVDRGPATRDPAQGEAASTEAEAEAVVISRTPVAPYPSAVDVRLFVQDGRDPEGQGLFADPDGRRLTQAERGAVEDTFKTAHYGPGARWTTACFIPHHFLRYYDAMGRQVGEISICFCCAGIRASPDLEEARGPRGTESSELTFEYDALKSVIEAMGVRTDIECD